MVSMHYSNIPFYVLERQKYVNLRKICPSMDIQGGCWIFRIQRGGFYKGKIPAVETPIGAMLWDIRNRVLCLMVIYYVQIPDPIIKLLVSVIQ